MIKPKGGRFYKSHFGYVNCLRLHKLFLYFITFGSL